MREGIDPATTCDGGSLPAFFALTVALSIPFWIAGCTTGLEIVPGLPVAALMAACPAIAALILTARKGDGSAVRTLIRRILDGRKIGAPWLLFIVLFKPGIMALSYELQRANGVAIPPPRFSVPTVALLFSAFLVFAVGEELGWTGYALDRLQSRRSALCAALVIGVVWAAWHIVPLAQAHRAPAWIGWWCLGTVSTRVILVWIYDNTNRSVFSTILYHVIDNVAWLTFPVGGSYFDPRVTGSLLAVCATIVAVAWRADSSSGSRPPELRPPGLQPL
jgi:membrane protease YdiL (CAAX protease family)